MNLIALKEYEEEIKNLNKKLDDREAIIKKNETKIEALELRISLYEKSAKLDHAKINSLLDTIKEMKSIKLCA